MAKLPNRRRILREDLKEAPSWIERLIGFINPFFEDIYYALNKQITHRENIDCDIRVIDFETSSAYDSGVPDVSEIEQEISDINDEIDLINEEIEEIQEELENISGAPIGEVMLWCSLVSIPIGYVLANGQVLSKTTYPDFYAIIGDTYNTGGEGPDEFRVPNYQGLVPRGWGSQSVNGRMKDGGSLGVILEDQMQKITGEFVARRAQAQFAGDDIGSFSSVAYTSKNYGGSGSASHTKFIFHSANSPNARTSSTTDGETRASSLSTVFLIKAFNASLAGATEIAIDILNAEVEEIKEEITDVQTVPYILMKDEVTRTSGADVNSPTPDPVSSGWKKIITTAAETNGSYSDYFSFDAANSEIDVLKTGTYIIEIDAKAYRAARCMTGLWNETDDVLATSVNASFGSSARGADNTVSMRLIQKIALEQGKSYSMKTFVSSGAGGTSAFGASVQASTTSFPIGSKVFWNYCKITVAEPWVG